MPNPATRLITLIMLLQRRPNQKAADLAAELGVSLRTVHRYFEMLDEIGIPVYAERGPYGGFSLVKGYRMPPLVFTAEEAVAVTLGASLVEEMWGQLYQEAARGALAKLHQVLPDEQRHEIAWARRALLATGMHRHDLEALAPVLEKLRRAARERRRVQMEYHGRSQPQPTRRSLDPYALVHRWGWWYVIGYCHLREGLRTFRVDRIAALALLESTFDVPPDFDLQAYLAQEPGAQPLLEVQLRFRPEAARLAYDNRAYWESLEPQEDGSVQVGFAAPDLIWAASMVLAYGPVVEVLSPPEVRQTVIEWAQATVNSYLEPEVFRPKAGE